MSSRLRLAQLNPSDATNGQVAKFSTVSGDWEPGFVGGLPFSGKYRCVDPTDPRADYSTIQAAITASSSGDVVVVAPGTYAEQITGKNGVIVYGLGGYPGGNSRVLIQKVLDANGSVVTHASGTFMMVNVAVEADWNGTTGECRAIEVTGGIVYLVSCKTYVINMGDGAGFGYCLKLSGGSLFLEHVETSMTDALNSFTGHAGLRVSGTASNLSSLDTILSAKTVGLSCDATGVALKLQNTRVVGALTLTNYTSLAIYGGNSATSVAGIVDDPTETKTTHYDYGKVLTNGKNDIYALKLRQLTADPATLVAGLVWYHAKDNLFRLRLAAATKAIGFLGEIRESSGPTDLTVGSIVDGQYLKRSGATIVSDAGAGGITADQHKALRQLIHFIDNGPAESFASGAYKETLPVGSSLPTSVIWYTAGDKLHKIVEKTYTWSGPWPNTIVWKVYSAADALLATVTDTYDYTGGNRITPKVTRTIA